MLCFMFKNLYNLAFLQHFVKKWGNIKFSGGSPAPASPLTPHPPGLPDSERGNKKGKKKGGGGAKKTLSLQNFLQDENQVGLDAGKPGFLGP